jgi:serine/threonine protein kinase
VSTSSELLPRTQTEQVGVGEDTNPPGTVDERTIANGGLAPFPLALAFRDVTFRSSEHPGDLGRLDRYRVLKQLGKGGMGAVYLGFDERLRRKVALKVMLPDAAADPQAKERFLREARAAAQIAHDNVIAIHEADEVDGIPYIAMQYLQGYPLDVYLAKKGRPSFPQVVRIGREIALGLAAAHRLGLVHRDIKPGNVWLEAPNGRVKILDFGLARPAKSAAGELTQSGAVVGTPAYMAPEQARGHAVDGRADLFSLGVVLYRLVTDHLPFDGPDVMAILTALAVEEPRPVLEWNNETPPALAELIHELLAKKPGARPQTADEVAARLFTIADRGPGATVKPVVYVPVSVTVLESGNVFEGIESACTEIDSSLSRRHAPPTVRQRPYAFIAGGVVSILLGAGLLTALVGGSKPETRNVDDRPAKKPTEPPKTVKKPEVSAHFDHSPFPKLDPAWLKTVSALPLTDILGPINEELKRRNPDYDGKGLAWVNDPLTGTKSALEVKSDQVADLMPLLAVQNLESLSLFAIGQEPSRLASVAPLRGLRKLRCLRIEFHTRLTDLGPLHGLPIEQLLVRGCGVESIEPLRGMPLDKLEIPGLFVPDLRPLARSPLRVFHFGHPDLAPDLAPIAECPLEHVRIEWGLGIDLAPLRRCPLKSFAMNYTAQPDLAALEGTNIEAFSGFDSFQYESFLRTLPKLATVGAYNMAPVPAADYFRDCDERRTKRDKWVAAHIVKPVKDRIAASRARFEKQNEGRITAFSPTIVDGEVIAIDLTGSDPLSNCWDLSFLRVFPKLKSIVFEGVSYTPLFHQVIDLPIEEIRIPGTAMHIGKNLHAFSQMKSLKKVNDWSIAEFDQKWRLFPRAKESPVSTPLDEQWLARVAALPAAEAVAEVTAELRRRNRGFEGTLEPVSGGDSIRTALRVVSCRIVDLAPLLALPELKELSLSGMGTETSPLVNLSPLTGLKHLRRLELTHHSNLTDLAPLAGMSLTNLSLLSCGVSDLAPLRGSRTINELNIHNSPIRSLEPVRGWPLKSIWFGHPDIVLDLAPLADTPLENVTILGARGLNLEPIKRCPLKSFTMNYTALPDLRPLEGSSIEKFSAYDPFQYEALLKTMQKLTAVSAYNLPDWIPRDEYFVKARNRSRSNEEFVASTRNLPLAERMDAVRKRFESHKQGQPIELELIVKGGEVEGIVLKGSGSPVNVWDLGLFRVFPKLRTFKSELLDDVVLLHALTDLPIETIDLPGRGDIHFRLNLESFARMKSLKTINGQSFAAFAKTWNLNPSGGY